MSDTRQHVHELVDRLPEPQIAGLERFLESIIDPVAEAVRNAPFDDEPFTEEDRRAVAEAEEWLKHNKPIPMEEVLADFGLTTADFEKMSETPLAEEIVKRNG